MSWLIAGVGGTWGGLNSGRGGKRGVGKLLGAQNIGGRDLRVGLDDGLTEDGGWEVVGLEGGDVVVGVVLTVVALWPPF